MPGLPSSTRQPVYFVGHAGVGLLFRDTPENRTVQQNIKDLGREILNLQPRPKALIVLSGHFEAGEIHGPGAIEVNVKKQTHIQVRLAVSREGLYRIKLIGDTARLRQRLPRLPSLRLRLRLDAQR